MDQWITACASVTGASHHKSGMPCQDASAVKVSSTGEWVVIVASDGAGTAKRAEEGSALVADLFLNALIDITAELDSRKPGHWINDVVIEKVLETRKSLRAKANSDNIGDFNCTLVACVLGPSGGFSVHIGDGAIFGGSNSSIDGNKEIINGGNFFISPPENGEYANETYFLTEGDWVKHLRITPMPKLDWVFACTDGGTALALVSDKVPKEGFIFPALDKVLANKSLADRNLVLRDILENPAADKVTGDDKTIAIACRKHLVGKIKPELQIPDESKNRNLGKSNIILETGLYQAASTNRKPVHSKRWVQHAPTLKTKRIIAIGLLLLSLTFTAAALFNNYRKDFSAWAAWAVNQWNHINQSTRNTSNTLQGESNSHQDDSPDIVPVQTSESNNQDNVIQDLEKHDTELAITTNEINTEDNAELKTPDTSIIQDAENNQPTNDGGNPPANNQVDVQTSSNDTGKQTDLNEGRVGVSPPTSEGEQTPEKSTVPKASNTTEIQETTNPTDVISQQPSVTDTDDSTPALQKAPDTPITEDTGNNQVDVPMSSNDTKNQADQKQGRVEVGPPTSGGEKTPDTSAGPKASNTTEIQGASNSQTGKDSQEATKPIDVISQKPRVTDTDASTNKQADQENPAGQIK